ncbi:MAG: 4Fe-4S binding protein [Bacteroidales bacterium]
MAWIKGIFSKGNIRGVAVLAATLFALPLGWGGFTGWTLWLSPFVMLNSVFVLKSLVWLNGLAVITLVFIFLRKRWFCQKICPVGWGCDLISSQRKGRGVSIKKIPPVGKWLAIGSLAAALAGIPLFILLDPMSVFNGFFMIFSGELTIPVMLSLLGLPLLLAINIPFPGIWCTKLCPLGGLQDEITTVKNLILNKPVKEKRIKTMASTGRRLFLVSGAGLLGALLLPSFIKPAGKRYLQPPGSVPADLFNTLCLRCGNCIKSCPTGILGHHMDPQNKISWMVPEISYINGYCLEKCNTCSRVCPSGSITLFGKDAKSRLFIGSAKIELANCLLARNTECDRCKAVCSYDAIRIEKTEGSIQMLPVVIEDRCVGCGACVVVCPPRVIEVILD